MVRMVVVMGGLMMGRWSGVARLPGDGTRWWYVHRSCYAELR